MFFHFSTRGVEPSGELSCNAPFDRGGQTRKVHFFGDAGEGRVAWMFVVAVVDHVLKLPSRAEEFRSIQHSF